MDRIGASVLLAFGLFLSYQASRLPMRALGEGPGPALFPMLVGVGISALAAVSFVRPDAKRFQIPQLGRVLLIVSTLVGYALALDRLGYVVTTSLALALLFCALADRGRFWLLLFAAALSIGSYYLFRMVLQVPLPPDPLDVWR